MARVLPQRSKIVVLDEPTAHVDPHTKQTIWNVVRDKLKESTFISIATVELDKRLPEYFGLERWKFKGFDKFVSIMNTK